MALHFSVVTDLMLSLMGVKGDFLCVCLFVFCVLFSF